MRPLILITNDDGISAPGIQKLIAVVRKLADVIVVAPSQAMSGKSNAITFEHNLKAECRCDDEHYMEYVVNGTPTDCVKLALNVLCKRRPDLLLSGINHGSNASVNIVYSGTMGAVFEGCVNAIPSIGLSHLSHDENEDMTVFLSYIKKIVQHFLINPLPYKVCMNVNFPIEKEVKGIKVCRQADAHWIKEYVEHIESDGSLSYSVSGELQNNERSSQETDLWALEQGYISMVPCKVDFTDFDTIKFLNNQKLDL